MARHWLVIELGRTGLIEGGYTAVLVGTKDEVSESAGEGFDTSASVRQLGVEGYCFHND